MKKLLFFDDTQLLEKRNLTRRVGQPQLVTNGSFQAPNTDLSFAYPTVFPLEEAGGWRLLYQALHSFRAQRRPRHFIPAVADSDDGITWRVPDLSHTVPIDERVLPNQTQPAVLDRFGEWGPSYYDPRAGDLQHRIKGFVCKGHGPGTGIKDSWIVTSPDGLTWQDLNGKLWHPHGSDPTVCAYWNQYHGVYTLVIRPHNGDRRIALMETPDWEQFSDIELALCPDALDPDLAEIYSMPTFPYANMFIGLVWLYHTPQTAVDYGKFLGGRINCQLAYSYDGRHFQRGLRDPLIDNTPPGSIGAGCILPSSMIVTDDEIRLYSCAGTTEHALYDEQHGPLKSAILMHRLRLDGFVYLDAGRGEASLKTRAMLVTGDQLAINAQVPDGQLAVEVTDANGNILEGYTYDDCQKFGGDDTRWIVRWRDGKQFRDLQQRAVQLSLRIRSGRLFAISGDFKMLTAKEGMRYTNHGTPQDPRNWGP